MPGLQGMNKRSLDEIKSQLAFTADMYFIELVYFVLKCLPFTSGHSQPISCDLAAFAGPSLIKRRRITWQGLSRNSGK